jgi:hypothetical protein
MALIPPPWLRHVVETSYPNIHPQIQVVLEAYANEADYSCPHVSPVLECDDCGTKVMLHESRTNPLQAQWWEVVGCRHVRGHLDCQPIYQGHSPRRCKAAQARKGISALPWILDGNES